MGDHGNKGIELAIHLLQALSDRQALGNIAADTKLALGLLMEMAGGMKNLVGAPGSDQVGLLPTQLPAKHLIHGTVGAYFVTTIQYLKTGKIGHFSNQFVHRPIEEKQSIIAVANINRIGHAVEHRTQSITFQFQLLKPGTIDKGLDTTNNRAVSSAQQISVFAQTQPPPVLVDKRTGPADQRLAGFVIKESTVMTTGICMQLRTGTTNHLSSGVTGYPLRLFTPVDNALIRCDGKNSGRNNLQELFHGIMFDKVIEV